MPSASLKVTLPSINSLYLALVPISFLISLNNKVLKSFLRASLKFLLDTSGSLAPNTFLTESTTLLYMLPPFSIPSLVLRLSIPFFLAFNDLSTAASISLAVSPSIVSATVLPSSLIF